MPKNKLSDLRNHLFATLEALSDNEKPMEVERARAIAEVASVVIDSAKVEVQVLKECGQLNASFFDGMERPSLPEKITRGEIN